MPVGNSKRISLEKDMSFELGSREVVTSIRGSKEGSKVSISRFEILIPTHNTRTDNSRQFAVLVIHVHRIVLLVRVSPNVVVIVFPKLLVVCDLGVQWLSRRQTGSQLRPLLTHFGGLELECSAIEVVPPLAGLFALGGGLSALAHREGDAASES
jgi:hypothetical protein